MKISEFFDNAGTRQIVINSDIDGFLSGMLLCKYYNCKVVGFTNSKESIWISPEVKSIKDPVYIDIFINSPEVFSIDQHIVAYNDDHIDRLLRYGTKMNPNLDISRRTFCGGKGNFNDYYHKYPFGTVHYLMAKMKDDGVDVEINDLETEYKVKGINGKEYIVTPGEIVLRADDALYSSLGKYEDNTKKWWEYLCQYNSSAIERLVQYLSKCDKKKNTEYKEKIDCFFKNGLNCDSKDGGFDVITDESSKRLQDRVSEYNKVINKIIGIDMELPGEYEKHTGIRNVGEYNEDSRRRAFTYAFVYGPTNANKCFSYTIDIE